MILGPKGNRRSRLANLTLRGYLANVVSQQKVLPTTLVDPRLAFACGGAALAVGLAIAIFIPRPEPFQLKMFAVTAGMGGASFGSGLTGLLEIKTRWLTAGGPLAVFVFIVWVLAGDSIGFTNHG
jgi:hypothetical protein